VSHEDLVRESHRRLRERREKWDRRYLELARHIGDRWSKDPSTKVGAVLVDSLGRVIPGYNGFPRSLSDDEEVYANRDKKLQRVIHAEMNAILNAQGSVRGMTLYTSVFQPCSRCAAHVIQAGIKRVVYEISPDGVPERWREDMEAALEMFKEAGVATVGIRL
jgi:dCMP deaminase